MKIDRARFLALVPLLLGDAGCGEGKTPAAPRAGGAEAVPIDVASASDAAAPKVAGGVGPDAGAVCTNEISVPDCIDFGPPGPTCEQGMSPASDCQRLRATLQPSAARRAMTCLAAQRGLCSAHAVNAAGECFLASFSGACEEQGAHAECARLTAHCGTRIATEECVAAVSAVVPAARTRFVSCIAESCSLQCFANDLLPSLPPPAKLAKAPPRDVATELARWPSLADPMPADWTQCKLSTDCTAVSLGNCRFGAVSRAAAGLAAERARRDLAGKPDRGRYVSCAGPPRVRCQADVCTSG